MAAPALASPLRTVGELISEAHPLYPYPSTRTFSVVLSTTWFTGDMPYYTGSHTCPASGCRINLYNRGGSDPSKADMLLYHLRPGDFHGEDSIAPPANGGKQLVGFMLAEGFNAADLPPTVFDKFNSEHSFRATSLVRDTYVLWFLNDAHKQGITNPQKPLSLDARVWQDIWEPPLPLAQRSKKYLASWGSHYCKGARSGREDLVRALLNAGLPLAVFGEDANCLRNVGPELLALGRGDQFKVMREHKFYLSFENHRLEGYVSEKVSPFCSTDATFPFPHNSHTLVLCLHPLTPSFPSPTPHPHHNSFTGPCCAGKCLWCGAPLTFCATPQAQGLTLMPVPSPLQKPWRIS